MLLQISASVTGVKTPFSEGVAQSAGGLKVRPFANPRSQAMQALAQQPGWRISMTEFEAGS